MRVSQSQIATWQRCPLLYRFRKIDGLVGEKSAAAPFGNVVHDAIVVLETTNDISVALQRFREQWAAADFDYFLPRTSFNGYLEKGEDILRKWWDIQQWNASKVLAREYYFEVPLGRHTLNGYIDRLELRYLGSKGGNCLCVLDYKTNAKLPTREYLRHDVQFTAYCYATTRPEFWAGFGDKAEEMFNAYKDWPRIGEWVALTQGPKRVPAGDRTERDYARLEMVVDGIEASIAMNVYIPTLTGAACEHCEFRRECGLPATKEEEE